MACFALSWLGARLAGGEIPSESFVRKLWGVAVSYKVKGTFVANAGPEVSRVIQIQLVIALPQGSHLTHYFVKAQLPVMPIFFHTLQDGLEHGFVVSFVFHIMGFKLNKITSGFTSVYYCTAAFSTVQHELACRCSGTTDLSLGRTRCSCSATQFSASLSF